MSSIEKNIESLDNIVNWSDKLVKIKEIKTSIEIQKKRLNNFIDMINFGDSSVIEIDDSLDNMIKQYEQTNDFETKINLFKKIQYIIKETEKELFDN